MNRSQVRRLHLLELEQVHHRHEGQEWVPHWHEEWSFGAVVQGECRCHVAGRPFQPRAGDIMAIAPHTVHTGVLSALPDGGGGGEPRNGPGDGGAVLVTMLYVPPAWLAREGLTAPARSGLVRSPALALQARGLGSIDEVQGWLRQAVPELAEALAAASSTGTEPGQGSSSDPRPSEAVRQLLEGIRAAVQQGGELSVSSLAQRCGVSRERIHQVVKRWVGLSPSDYLRTVRLHRARDLLLAGQPLATVAADCGFADQAHFTRWFRRAFGYTPGDWVGTVA